MLIVKAEILAVLAIAYLGPLIAILFCQRAIRRGGYGLDDDRIDALNIGLWCGLISSICPLLMVLTHTLPNGNISAYFLVFILVAPLFLSTFSIFAILRYGIDWIRPVGVLANAFSVVVTLFTFFAGAGSAV